KKQQAPVLVNLASNEYFKAVKPKLLEGRLLNINFKETKDGKTRVVAIFAKRARGMMADYIIRNRIENPEDIKKFRLGGYRFDRKLSDETQWTFERAQP
ncbi:MAG TPA: peroxide stress protein YaaA, partial [Thiotrichales bacterium]|nr:peroxide stress protein YaaA [Thiotrichales bacterium]